MMPSQESAETVGLQSLAWLAGKPDLFEAFLGTSGATADDVKDQAQNPEFLGAVLDFLLMDDAWVLLFCNETGLSPDVPMQARAALPGGAQINWT